MELNIAILKHANCCNWMMYSVNKVDISKTILCLDERKCDITCPLGSVSFKM